MSFKQLPFETHPNSRLSAPFSMSVASKSEATRKNIPNLQTSSRAGTNLFCP
jgi:hypothetical protein